MLPAEQRLDADDPAASAGRRSAGSGRASSSRVERVPQLVLELEPARAAWRSCRGSKSSTSPPAGDLRPVHGDVGVAQQRRRRRSPRAADRRPRCWRSTMSVAAVEPKRLARASVTSRSATRGRRRRRHVLAASPRTRRRRGAPTVSPGADRWSQPRAAVAQQLVAGGVAERVVDDLEAVEVDEQQRRGAALPACRAASARSSCSMSRARFGRPVSSSWSAAASARPRRLWRSVTSEAETTQPRTSPSRGATAPAIDHPAVPALGAPDAALERGLVALAATLDGGLPGGTVRRLEVRQRVAPHRRGGGDAVYLRPALVDVARTPPRRSGGRCPTGDEVASARNCSSFSRSAWASGARRAARGGAAAGA